MEWSTVQDWLLSHGVRILIIILVSAVLYIAMRRLVPLILKNDETTEKREKGQGEPGEKDKNPFRHFCDHGIVDHHSKCGLYDPR